MVRKRGFEIIEKYQDAGINLPKRATHQAAGYDFEAAEDILVPSFWKVAFKNVSIDLKQWIHARVDKTDASDTVEEAHKAMKPVLVPTGIKAYMQEDEYLQLTNRSSNPLKNFLILPNGVGVVDADYYNNPDNEGHIYFQMSNFGLRDKIIKKGDRIGQGIFIPFLKADGDVSVTQRTGGFGSSGENSLEEPK